MHYVIKSINLEIVSYLKPLTWIWNKNFKGYSWSHLNVSFFLLISTDFTSNKRYWWLSYWGLIFHWNFSRTLKLFVYLLVFPFLIQIEMQLKCRKFMIWVLIWSVFKHQARIQIGLPQFQQRINLSQMSMTPGMYKHTPLSKKINK